jgi:hypothetical protein
LTFEDVKTAQPFVTTGAAVAFAFLFVHQCNRASSAEAELNQAREGKKLLDAGLPPETEGSAKDLKSALDAEKRNSAAFKRSAEEAEKALADLRAHPKLVEVVKWRTKPGAATGRALPPAESTPRPPGCPPDSPCLVREGTPLAIEGREGRFETRAGNRVVVGSADVLRLDPTGPTQIYSQEIDFKLTSAVVEQKSEPATERPWIAGISGSVDGHGSWGVGPLLGFSKSRIGASVSLTFPNSIGIVSGFARF